MMTSEQRSELVGLLCDVVEYFCDEQMISGETAWKEVEALSIIRQQMMKGNRL